jgi:hypothetical protein
MRTIEDIGNELYEKENSYWNKNNQYLDFFG